jgi:alanine racemase
MAQTLPDVCALAQHSALSIEQIMTHLLSAETIERDVRSKRYQVSSAKFPTHRGNPPIFNNTSKKNQKN